MKIIFLSLLTILSTQFAMASEIAASETQPCQYAWMQMTCSLAVEGAQAKTTKLTRPQDGSACTATVTLPTGDGTFIGTLKEADLSIEANLQKSNGETIMIVQSADMTTSNPYMMSMPNGQVVQCVVNW